MTNEQLALLLYQLAKRLYNLADEIEPTITEGERELVMVWTGEGDEPTGTLEILTSRDYELQPIGGFTATQKVIDFADDLINDADALTDTQPNKLD